MKNVSKSTTQKIWGRVIFSPPLDKGIEQAVIILNNHGFKTFESCQGGKGHCGDEAFVRFHGTEFDCIRAYEICSHYKLNVSDVRRVYRKVPVHNENETIQITENWEPPFNEIVFHKNSKTKTIFCRH